MLKRRYSILFILLVWLTFSFPYFFQNKVPFASSYQVNFFSPWSTYQELASPVKNNAQPDIITQIYPWRYFAIEEWKAGRIPLWNPYSFSGTPHLANYQSAVLFPLNILFFLPISFLDGWSILVLLQPLLAGLFTYLYARSLRISKTGSTVASLSFMFCGFVTTWMGYGTLPYAIIFLPLALYSIEKYSRTNNSFYGMLLSFSILMSFLSGHFQTSLYFFITIVAYVLYILFGKKKLAAILYVYIFLGLLMTMPQLLPSIELYQESVRSQLFRSTEAIPWNYFPTIFAPDYYGNPVTRNDWFGHYAEWNSFSGTIVVLLAIFSLFIKKSKHLVFFIAISIFALLLAFDTPFYALLVSMEIPVLSTSAASRIIVLFSFSVAIMAGFSIDAIIKKTHNRKRIFIWSTLVIAIFITLVIFSFFIPESDKRFLAQKNLILPIILSAILLTSVISIYFLKRQSLVKFVPIILILMLGFEMVRFASKWQAFDNRDLVFKKVPTTEYYSKDFGARRFFGDFTAENSVYYRLQTLGGYDPLYPGRYGKFVKYIGDGNLRDGERSAVVFPKKGLYVPQTLDFLGVNFIAHKLSDGNFPWAFPFSEYPVSKFTPIYNDGHYQIFENTTAYERAYIVFETIKKSSEKEILDTMFLNDLSKTAIVENDIDLEPEGNGNVRIKNYDPTNIAMEVSTDKRGLVVLTDNYYPGWNVYVNGKKEKIERVNFSFRGVVVPKGDSIIEFKYIPQSFSLGIYLFLVGLFGVIIMGLFKNLSGRK